MKKLLFVLLFVFVMTSASAIDPSFIFKKNDIVDVKVSCFDVNNTLCSALTYCNLTIHSPNASNLIRDGGMTFNDQFYNYSLTTNQTSTVGEHSVVVRCTGDTSGFSTFTYLVNPTGIRPSEERTQTITRTVYFLFGIGILLFVGFIFYKGTMPVKLTFLFLAGIMFLIGINMIFLSLQDEIVNPNVENFFDTFTSVSWILYWFLGGLLLLMWLYTFWNSWFLNKNQENLARFG